RQLLEQARTLMANGNYQAAREKANEAKSGDSAVSAQADELIAQIALAEQGGALSLYEAALASARKGEYGRARALLAEGAASGAALDDALNQKVQDLLLRLPKEDGKDAGKATASDLSGDTIDKTTIEAQRLNAEVGTRVATARRLLETDPEQAIKTLQETL